MKLIIDIPNEAYEILTEYQVLPENIDLEYFVMHGIPLEEHCESCMYYPTETEDD